MFIKQHHCNIDNVWHIEGHWNYWHKNKYLQTQTNTNKTISKILTNIL